MVLCSTLPLAAAAAAAAADVVVIGGGCRPIVVVPCLVNVGLVVVVVAKVHEDGVAVPCRFRFSLLVGGGICVVFVLLGPNQKRQLGSEWVDMAKATYTSPPITSGN